MTPEEEVFVPEVPEVERLPEEGWREGDMVDTYDELLALLADSPEQAEPAQPQPQIPPRPQPELPPQPQPLPEQLSYDDIRDLIK